MNTITRPTILVVEDDTNLLSGICDILEMAEYNVFGAASGLDALDVLRTKLPLPNIIVSDIMMPYMDGYELLNAVRQERDWTEIPFIFLTARTEKGDIRSGMVAGADDYLPKPFKTDDLLLAIRAKLKRRAELANVRALQIREIKRGILTILNHEFRTPLSPVVAYADMLNSDPTTLTHDELKAFLQGINTGAKRLRRLVEDFILLIELETGEAQTAYNYRHALITDLGALLETAIAQFAETLINRDVHLLSVPIPTSLPPFVADPEYLIAALLRLLDNAVKFTDQAGGKVQISAEADASGDWVLIHVADTGRGIPPDEFAFIFDSFYQIERKRYEDQGTGSGLAIVKAIMELHGGEVRVESEIGKGSVFTLYLPAA